MSVPLIVLLSVASVIVYAVMIGVAEQVIKRVDFFREQLESPFDMEVDPNWWIFWPLTASVGIVAGALFVVLGGMFFSIAEIARLSGSTVTSIMDRNKRGKLPKARVIP